MTIQLPVNESFTNEPIVPDLIIWIYVAAIVVLGFLLNLIMMGALMVKSKCNGKTLMEIHHSSGVSLAIKINLSFRYIDIRHTDDSE